MDQHPGQVAPYGQGANSSTKNKLMNSKFRERRRRRRGAKCNSTAVSNSGPADDVNRTIKETVSNCDDYSPSPGGRWGWVELIWEGCEKAGRKKIQQPLTTPQRNTRIRNDRDRCAVSCKKYQIFIRRNFGKQMSFLLISKAEFKQNLFYWIICEESFKNTFLSKVKKK